MRTEILAVGTELLLGQIVDTNSSYIGEQLAASGIDCHFQTRVGDNLGRIVLALRTALARSDAVIVCGGLGPTQDDITREAIAEVMNVPLHRDAEVLDQIRAMFVSRQREMPANNGRQADLPEGATFIRQRIGTAPGLICPVGQKVVYAVPGVPYEMHEMLERAVLPDLRLRAGEVAVIASRTLRTWGLSESGLAEMLSPRIEALGDAGTGVPTIAFLASGIEGIKVRLTVKAADLESASAALDAEAAEIRSLLGRSIFGVDDATMESVVGELLLDRGWRLGLAESLTGGLVASRIVSIPGASEWFSGSIVSYASAVKRSLLGVPEGPVVSDVAAAAMASGARTALETDVGLSTTGVAGPTSQDDHEPG
ncbi:MAG TPA: CinA family nicotinamide mononucleotide deamidase-related protein, partial [Acidimicrobiales bacterium]|nr:CinA family nicotinamide mononucleotide deamidase-related protein [Acidimicrobiales bacterium]